MQWLIDLIKEWVESQDYASKKWAKLRHDELEAWVGQQMIDLLESILAKNYLQHSYVHNPCTNGWDFTKVDLTTDANWHDLDLSGIIPVEAKAVLVFIRIRDTLTGLYALLSTPGETEIGCFTYLYNQVSGIRMGACYVITPDANRKIIYKFSDQVWDEIHVKIMGWWL